MTIEPMLFYSVSASIIVYVAALGYVIHMLQEERDYYKTEYEKYNDLWIEALKEYYE